MDELYTTNECGRLLGFHRTSVQRWVNMGQLLAFKTPGGHRRIRASDLRSFIIAQKLPWPAGLERLPLQLVVVDDDRVALAALKRAFGPLGSAVEVVTTTSGGEAAILVTQLRPHCLLVDLDIPGFDGLGLVRRVRARKPLEGVRMLTMTGRHSKKAIKDSVAAGAITCLEKPVQREAVLEHFMLPLALAAGR